MNYMIWTISYGSYHFGHRHYTIDYIKYDIFINCTKNLFPSLTSHIFDYTVLQTFYKYECI